MVARPEDPQPSDPLFELQLRVARKADALVSAEARARGLNLECWLLAEAEVLGALRAPPATPSPVPTPGT
jgi:hypothetical protein